MSFENFQATATEFPDFDLKTLPDAILLFAKSPHVEDKSWRNDACPHLTVLGAFPLWFEEQDRDAREYPDMARFCVSSSFGGDPETFYTDNASDAVMVACVYAEKVLFAASKADMTLAEFCEAVSDGEVVLDFAEAVKEAEVAVL